MAKKEGIKKVIHWAPRILMIIFIGLLSTLALDVFGEYKGLELLLAFFMHMIPSIILFIFLAIAWHWEIVGGSIFIAMGVVFGFFFNAFQSFPGFMILVLPLWLVGILFLADHKINS